MARSTSASPARTDSPEAGEVEDPVGDQLPGPVVGDVASAVGSHQLGTDRLGWHQYVLLLGPHTERVHMGMLEEKQIVVGGPGEQGALEGVGVVVADPPEPACPKHRRPWLPRLELLRPVPGLEDLAELGEEP